MMCRCLPELLGMKCSACPRLWGPWTDTLRRGNNPSAARFQSEEQQESQTGKAAHA